MRRQGLTAEATRRKWYKLVVRVISAQGMVQLLGFVTGIAIVSSLSKESYAEYIIVVALIAAMVSLSEAGISSVLLSMGGQIAREPTRLSALFSGALKYRYKVGVCVALCGNAVLVLALKQIGTDNFTCFLYVLVTSITLIPILAKGVFQAYLRLRLDVSTLQRIAMFSGLLRFVLIMPMALSHLANVYLLLAAGLLIALLEAWFLRRRVVRELDLGARLITDYQSAFRKSFRQTMPMNLPFVVQGQVLYLMLAWLGSALVLAEVAALSRFGLVFVVFNALVTDVAAGVIARQAGSTSRLLKLYLTVLFGYLVCAGVLVLGVFLFATPLLGLLGEQYAGLELPLVVIAAGSALINVGTALVTLNHARGWLKWSWIFLPVTVCWCAYGILFLDLNNVFEAAILMAAQAVPLLLTQGVCLVSGARRHVASNQAAALKL